MAWKDKFPFKDIPPLTTRIRYINESSDGHLKALIPDNIIVGDLGSNRRKDRVDHGLIIGRVSAKDLSKSDLKACLDLVESTSSHDYKASSLGWSRARKSKEMRLPDLRYLLLRRSNDETPQGFMSFMLTFEDGFEVIYLYEIHLHDELQGLGLGKQLMSILEGAGEIAEVKKSMLTVFKANKKALRFYKKLGYAEDDFSPRPRKLRNGVVKEPDYVILSKEVSMNYNDTKSRHLNNHVERVCTSGSSIRPSKKRKAR